MEIKNIQARKAYFDTNIFIYLFEDHPKYSQQIIELIQHLDNISCRIITSEMSLAECLVKPFSENDDNSIELYQKNLQNSEFLQMISVSRDVLIYASAFRSSLKNKLPDSIHIATAFIEKCDIFIGNDISMKVPYNMQSIVLAKL